MSLRPGPPPPVWDLPGPAVQVFPELVHDLGLPPVVARLLANRGLSSAVEARAWLNPGLDQLRHPESMAGMAEAVDLLVNKLNWRPGAGRGWRPIRLEQGTTLIAGSASARPAVGVYSDYDVDGITAAACLVDFFSHFGIPTAVFQPHRLAHGYGLKPAGLDLLHGLGAGVVITADCGIQDLEAVAHGRDLGLEMIVTDHHQPGPRLPDAAAVINPHRPDCPFHGEPLAGVGVAFCLVVALRSRLRSLGLCAPEDEPNLGQYLDLVALGTLADAVPLTGQNRVLAALGLDVLDRTGRPGLRSLIEVAGVKRPIDSVDVTFRLGPRLNAPGRLDDAALALELVLSPDPDRADRLARELDDLNQRRLEAQLDLMAEVLDRVNGDSEDQGAIVLHGPHWHRGVLGIVAARMVRDYGRPTILLAGREETVRGSGRAPEGIDLYTALSQCAGHLAAFGGHRAAAGLALRLESLDEFRRRFSDLIQRQAPDGLAPRLRIEAELKPDDLAPDLLDHLLKMAPFGQANPEPVFLIRNARPLSWRLIKDRHLKLELGVGRVRLDAIGFNQAGKLNRLDDRIEIVGRLRLDAYTGGASLHFLDLRPSG
jgi:single-stranded-DNA-specific exonuclease